MPILIPLTILFTIIFLVLLGIIYFYYQNSSKKHTKLDQSHNQYIPKGSTFEFIEAKEVDPDQVLIELEKINLMGRIENDQIQHVYLVHGTFVGDDPWNIFEIIKIIFPKINEKLISKLKSLTKISQDYFSADLGNFSSRHEAILNKTLPHTKITNFAWSSANHHCARVIGCFELIDQIVKNNNQRDKILLIGHSHAGQLFALITLIIADLNRANYFYELVKEFIPQVTFNSHVVDHLKSLEFKIVTLGTPPRYSWEKLKNIDLYHFINHRGRDVFAGDNAGALQTKDGDYIQQWGLTGSDIQPAHQSQKNINEKLDFYLGIGTNLKTLKENISKKRRLHNYGHHFLVDYHDNSKIPNFYKTIFGHGNYTRLRFLPFLLDTILK